MREKKHGAGRKSSSAGRKIEGYIRVGENDPFWKGLGERKRERIGKFGGGSGNPRLPPFYWWRRKGHNRSASPHSLASPPLQLGSSCKELATPPCPSLPLAISNLLSSHLGILPAEVKFCYSSLF
jgi:hypothetical protein